LNAGSGAALEKRSSEQLQSVSSELSVVCSEAGPVRVKEFSAQLQFRTDNILNVPRVLSRTELWPQPLVEIAIVPCIDSGGGEGCDWMGGPVEESEPSGLQVGDEGEALAAIFQGVLFWWSSRWVRR
jgi:hypothetical protein